MFNCPLCRKLLSTQSRLNYHIDNQVCIKPDRTCITCHKTFSSKHNLIYHISNGVCNKKKPKLILKRVVKPSYEDLTKEELIAKLTETETKRMEAETKYKTLRENPQTINNSINVFPRAFGKEDMNHVQQKFGDFLGSLIKNHPHDTIQVLFKQIHNNDRLPEYHNVYSVSERAGYALVSDGKSFVYRPKKTVIDEIIEDKRSILNRYADENGEQLGERVLAKYEKYQNQLDDNSEFRKTLEVEIGGLLLDMKAVIANDDKTRQLLDKVNDGQYELTQ